MTKKQLKKFNITPAIWAEATRVAEKQASQNSKQIIKRYDSQFLPTPKVSKPAGIFIPTLRR